MHKFSYVEEWGKNIMADVFNNEQPGLETRLREKLHGLNYTQMKAILTWIKGEITWDKSIIWKEKNKNKDEQIIALIDQILYETEYNKKNLFTKPRKHQKRKN